VEKEIHRGVGHSCFQKHYDALVHRGRAPGPPLTAMKKEL